MLPEKESTNDRGGLSTAGIYLQVREDHVKLRVNKLPTISVVYTHGLDEPVRPSEILID